MSPGRLPARGVAFVLCALLLLAPLVAVSSPVRAQEGTVVGRPDLDLFLPENRVTAGEQTTLEVFVTNKGLLTRGGPAQFEEQVKTARGVRFSVEDRDLPPELRDSVHRLTASVPVGNVPEGVSGPFAYRIEVDESVEPGTYTIPVRVTYDYTRFVQYSDVTEPRYGITTETVRRELTLVVEDQPRFAYRTDGAVVGAGETADRQVTVTNAGTEAATDATLVLAAGNTSVFFGGPDQRSRVERLSLGRLAPGTSRTVTARVGAPGDLPPGAYPLEATVDYRAPSGVRERSPARSIAVPVGAGQTFALGNVSDTLRVGERGVVRGTVVNTGDRPAVNAVVAFPEEVTGLRARQPAYAVGVLSPGEAAPFEFSVDVANDSAPGPVSLPLRVRYRDATDAVQTSDPVDAEVTVAAEQSFAVADVTGDLRVGERGAITGRIRNAGNESVTDAVVVLDAAGAGVQPRETRYPVGDLDADDEARFRFPVAVDGAADAGPRLLQFRVRYRGPGGEVRVGDSLDARVAVDPEQSFALADVTSTLRVGERGVVRGTVVNTGAQSVSNVALVPVGNGSDLQPREPAVAVGTLAPGDRAGFRFTVDVPQTVGDGSRLLQFRVRYRDAADDVRTSDVLDARVPVGAEQSFAVADVTGDLRVDETGEVRGRLVNTGPVNATGVVLLVEEAGPTLLPRETEYAVGSLAPGASQPFSFRFDVTADAEPGPRLVTLRVRYRGQGDQVRQTDPLDARVVVAPERDEFALTPVNATLTAGRSTVVSLRVRNLGTDPVRDVRARVFADDPLSSDDDAAFVSALGPNETATLRFELAASGGAVAKDYPLLVDFTYENAAGESVLSDTYFVPIRVGDAPPRRFPIDLSVPVLAAAGLVVLTGLGYWKWSTIRAALARLRPRRRD
ncbi:MAG: COG1361 S-layer family protein [Haloarculaceae archaeon]